MLRGVLSQKLLAQWRSLVRCRACSVCHGARGRVCAGGRSYAHRRAEPQTCRVTWRQHQAEEDAWIRTSCSSCLQGRLCPSCAASAAHQCRHRRAKAHTCRIKKRHHHATEDALKRTTCSSCLLVRLCDRCAVCAAHQSRHHYITDDALKRTTCSSCLPVALCE